MRAPALGLAFSRSIWFVYGNGPQHGRRVSAQYAMNASIGDMQTPSIVGDADRSHGTRRGRAPGFGLVVALGGFIAWSVTFTLMRPDLVGDERHHVPAIRDAAAADWTTAMRLPMPPTFHWLAVQATRATGPTLGALRAFQTLWTLLAILLYHAAARAYRPEYAGRDLLRFAWHPLLVAFGALVCTDIAALVGILVALNFHVRRRYVLAALGLVGAILIRQSNVVWAGYFLAWALAGDWLRGVPVTSAAKPSNPRDATARRTPVAGGDSEHSARSSVCRCVSGIRVVREALWPVAVAQLRAGAWAYLLVFLLGSVTVALAGRGVLLARAMSNEPAFNPAVFYLLVITAALLWLPVWAVRVAEFWPRRFAPALLRAWPVALVLAATGVVALEFRNPHPWNMDPEFPHNWPLSAMVQSSAARVLFAALIVAFAITHTADTARSPARRMLMLTWLFTLGFLLPHNLADLRYYLVPLVLVDFLTPRGPGEGRVLAVWHLALSLAVVALLALRLGGITGML
jgi:hypothetical protein